MSENYTSDSEFSLVKRVQITNEVPPVSLWHLLPNGLKNEFWKYFIGTVVTTEEGNPVKIVNGIESTTYGKDNNISLQLDGAIIPEFDFLLHELYRYLGTVYPDHPDFDQLLTTTEIDDALLAAASIIGYVPNYKLQRYWGYSFNGRENTQEELKWKIRDLRSHAFKRKFSGSYQGYKMLFGGIYRHGSVYQVGRYIDTSPTADLTGIDDRQVRFIDYYGKNDELDRAAAWKIIKGYSLPSNAQRLYSTTEIPESIVSGVTIVDDLQVGYITQVGEQLSVGGAEIYFADTATLDIPHRSYTVQREVTREGSVSYDQIDQVADIKLVPAFLEEGTFYVGYKQAALITQEERDALLDLYLCDNYKFGVTDRVSIGHITEVKKGKCTLVIDPERSASMSQAISDIQPVWFFQSTGTLQVINSDGSISLQEYETVMQGSIAFETDVSARPISCKLDVFAIPEFHPLTGKPNRELFETLDRDPFAKGTAIKIFRPSEDNSLVEMQSMYSWVDAIDWGTITAERVEVSDSGVVDVYDVQPFTPETIRPWIDRCAVDIYVKPTKYDEVTINGIVYDNDLPLITIPANQTQLLAGLTPGDKVRGRGIQPGTVISEVGTQTITVTKKLQAEGACELSISTSLPLGNDLAPLAFKSGLMYPTDYYLNANAHRGLWPSPIWPRTSLGYLEGIKDISALKEEIKDTYNPTAPHQMTFNGDLFVEVSLDRALYHANTQGSTAGSTTQVCLMDTPWLEHLARSSAENQKASDTVRVGSQLTLCTDMSGLYSIDPELTYTDPTIMSQFVTFPKVYETNPNPAYIRLGLGGFDAVTDRLFLNAADLLRDTLYGDGRYDENYELTDERAQNRRGRFLYTSGEASREGDATSSAVRSSGVSEPIFEVPLTEYENFVLNDPEQPGNTYNVHQTSFYEEIIRDKIKETNEISINSPSLLTGEQLPKEHYQQIGWWTPVSKELDEYSPDYPPTTGRNDLDYYIITTTVTIGDTTYNQGDWLIYTKEDGWKVRRWLLLGEWPSAGVTDELVFSPTVTELLEKLAIIGVDSVEKAIDEYFLYFIASRDIQLVTEIKENNETGEVIYTKENVDRFDWVILTKEYYADRRKDVVINIVDPVEDEERFTLVGDHMIQNTQTGEITRQETLYALGYQSYQRWYRAKGASLDIIKQLINQGVMDSGNFNAVVNQRQQLIDNIMYSNKLPRRFLTQGTCDSLLRLNLDIKTLDIEGNEFTLTESAIYFDEDKKLFYTESDKSGVLIRHYIAFDEPTFYKNLLAVTGTVHKDFPQIFYPAVGVEDFPIKSLALTDTVINSNQIFIRPPVQDDQDCSYFSHYVSIKGLFEKLNDTTLKIAPVSQGALSVDNIENFRIALQGLAVEDPVAYTHLGHARSYKDEYENKYFKNLLCVIGKITKDKPFIVQAASSSLEDITAMSTATLSIIEGDILHSAYCSDGAHAVYSTGILTDTETEFDNLTIAEYSDGIWMLGGDQGFLAVAEQKTGDGNEWLKTGWVEKTLPFGNQAVKAIAPMFVEDAWMCMAEDGQLAQSTDRGDTWYSYNSQSLVNGGWATSNTNKGTVLIQSSFDRSEQGVKDVQLLMANERGQVAVYVQNRSNVIESTPGGWMVYQLPRMEGLTDAQLALFNSDPLNNIPQGATIDANSDAQIGWGTDSQPLAPLAAAYSDIYCIIAGEGGIMSRALRSDLNTGVPDCWEVIDIPNDLFQHENSRISSVVYANNLKTWFALAYSSTDNHSAIFSSTDDGLSWGSSYFPSDDLDSILDTTDAKYLTTLVYDNGELLAAGECGGVVCSTDGYRWIKKDFSESNTVGKINAIGHSDNGIRLYAGEFDSFAASGEPNKLLVSINGLDITPAITVTKVGPQGMTGFQLSKKIIEDTRWKKGEVEKLVLLSLQTAASIEGFDAIAGSRLSTFTDTAGNLLVTDCVPVKTPSAANRVYLPRTRNDLMEEFDPDTLLENPRFIGVNGYPLYKEQQEAYVQERGSYVDLMNGKNHAIYHCDQNGSYIDNNNEAVTAEDFLPANVSPSLSTVMIEPRARAAKPKYPTYLQWLQQGNDIQVDTSKMVDILEDATISVITNKQGEDPYLQLTNDAFDLSDVNDHNAFEIVFLPNNPVPVVLEGVPHYDVDLEGLNIGFQATVVGKDVYYNMTPIENKMQLVPTVSTNQGVVSTVTDGTSGDLSTTYSIQPVRYFPGQFQKEDDGTIVSVVEDGVRYYVLDSDTITGSFFPEEGYGSWLNIVSDNLPWENDSFAFHTEIDPLTGKESFIYMKNKKGGVINLCSLDGKLIKDDDGNTIPVPASKYFAYKELVAEEGVTFSGEPIPMTSNPSIVLLDDVGQQVSFDLPLPVVFAEGEEEKNIQLILLTRTSVNVANSIEAKDTKRRHKLSVSDLYTYTPDRVCYELSRYPEYVEDHPLWQTGLEYKNHNGSTIYRCDLEGNYVFTDASGLPQEAKALSQRETLVAPLYESCQQWFEQEFFVKGQETNPFWQWIKVQDVLDEGSKQWKQSATLTRKLKDETGTSMIDDVITGTEHAFVEINKPLITTRGDTSFIATETEFINHKEGEISMILTTNSIHGNREDEWSGEVLDKIKRDKRLNNTLEQYGIPIITEWSDIYRDPSDNLIAVDVFDTKTLQQSNMTGNWIMSYNLNSLRSISSGNTDSQESVVAIKEMGLYNTDDELLAYARFPAVIYDSIKNHLSLNIFIKHENFSLNKTN